MACVSHLWSLFIFRRLSTWEPASTVCNDEKGDLFLLCILHFYTGTGVSHSQNRNWGRGFAKNADEWTGRVEISKEEITGSRRSMRGYIRTWSRPKNENLWAWGVSLNESDLNDCICSSSLQVRSKELVDESYIFYLYLYLRIISSSASYHFYNIMNVWSILIFREPTQEPVIALPNARKS